MEKVTLLCVGKIKESYLNEGIAEYVKRLKKYCALTIAEIPDRPDSMLAAEKESAELVKKLTGKSGYKVLFDLNGDEITSPELSQLFAGAYTRGLGEVTLVIGGSNGVTDEVRQLCDKKIRFGRVTFPHRLMRLMAVEQIYRAFSILNHTPYHK